MIKHPPSTVRRKETLHRKEDAKKRQNGAGGVFQSMIQTRSIERVLAPIAAQVSQLIILNETAEREGGKLPNLIPFAQTVLRATEDLVQVGHKMARDTDDQKLQCEMPEVCDATIAAGRSMLMAVQLLQAEPLSEPARDNMVKAARRLLETTMKVLLISDDAEVRRIVDACEWVRDGLQTLKAVGSMKELVSSFKGFSNSVLVLCDLCDKRQQDLSNPEKKEKILHALTGLKRAMPLLNSAMQNYVKYPSNVQTKASRDYTCKQVTDAVSQIQEAVRQGSNRVEREEKTSSADNPGHFAHNMEKLIELLSPNQRMKLDKQFDQLLEQTVRHGMSIATASRDELKDEIVRVCREILQVRSDVREQYDAVQENPTFTQLVLDFRGACESLAQDLLTLENLVKSALVHHVVDVFTETTEPLDRLVKTATVRLKEKGPLKEGLCQRLLQPLDDSFHDHADRIFQVASYVAASCVDRNRGQGILTLVANMEELDSDIFPSCLAVRQNLSNKGALEHLKLVRREWHSSVRQLIGFVDDLIEAQKFIEVSESCLEGDVENCRQAGMISDPDLLSEAANNILGRCKRVLHVAKQHRDKHEDAVYRNGLQVFINHMENAIPLVKNGAHYAMGNVENKRAMLSLQEHGRHLLDCVQRLGEGLDAANHPDILSPLRRGQQTQMGMSHDRSHDRSRDIQDDTGFLKDTEPRLSPKKSISSKSRSQPSRSDEDYLSKSTHYLSLLDATPSFHLPSHAISTPQAATSRHPRSRVPDPSFASGPLHPRKITKDMIHKLEMAYPMNELVRALFSKQRDQLVSMCQETRTRVEAFPSLLKRMKKLEMDVGKLGSIETKVLYLQEITSDHVGHFEKSLHGDDSDKADSVIRAEKWSGHMTDLVTEMQDLIGWCAELGQHSQWNPNDQGSKSIEAQLDHVASMKTGIMRVIGGAVCLKETLQSLDGGDTPTHAMHIQQLKSRASDWSKVTNTLHSLTNEILMNEDDRALLAKSETLTLEWAMGTLELMAMLDLMFMGQRSKEVTMVTAVRSGQEDQVLSEVKGLNVKCRELKEQTSKALNGCADTNKQVTLSQALKEMEQCTNTLATASISMATNMRGQSSAEGEFRFLKIGLLQREWMIKTQMVECQLDSLIIEMLIPLDRLTGTALAARQAQGSSRQQIMEEFQTQADGLGQAVTKLRQDCNMLMQGVFTLPEKDIILQCTDTLVAITPAVVAQLRLIADNTSMSSAGDMMSQKREWACNAKALIHAINALPGVDAALKQEMTRSLLQDHSPPSSIPATPNMTFSTPQARVGPSTFFTPITLPQLTPEQWRIIQTLTQQGIPLIQTPPGGASPDLQRLATPRSADATPRQDGMSPRNFSPGRLRSLHQSYQARKDQSIGPTSPSPSPGKKGSPLDESSPGPAGPYRSRTLGIADTPRSLKIKSASTSSLLSVNSTAVSETGSVKYCNSITAAALALQQETDRWEEDKNEIIRVAKVMSQQMAVLATFARRHSCIEDKDNLITTAKEIAANGLVIVRFADIIAKNSVDERFTDELLNEARDIPTFSTQLSIIASVKAATPDDLTSNANLVKNAENLMTAVVRTLKAAEAACVKGLHSHEDGQTGSDNEAQEAKALAMQWKRKLHRHRLIEASNEETDHLGLRKIRKNISAPSLTEIVMT